MNSRAAFWVLAVVFVGLLGVFFYLTQSTASIPINSDTSTAPVPPPDAPRDPKDADTVATPAPSPETPAMPTETAPAAEASAPEPETSRSPKGRGSVSGTVELLSGVQRQQVVVLLMRVEDRVEGDPEAEAPDWSTSLDTDNGFRFDDLPLGAYFLKARAEGAIAAAMPKLTRERPDYTARMVMGASGPLEGRVVNTAGEPVADARVFVTGTGETFRPLPASDVMANQVRTDEAGYFHAPDHGISPHWLKVTAKGYAPQGHGPVNNNQKGVVITLHQGGSAAGVVLVQDSRAPAPGAEVVVREDTTGVEGKAKADDAGRFVLAALAPGAYVATATAEGFARSDEAKFQISDGVEQGTIEIYVTPEAVITGRVYDGDTDKGIAGMRVYARSGRGNAEATTERNGAYRLAGLSAGQYDVQLIHQQDSPYPRRYEPPRNVSVAAGAVVEGINFVLSQGLSLAGHVMDAEGQPITGANVSASHESVHSSDETDENGAFIVRGLGPSSQVRVWASATGYGSLSAGNYDLSNGSIDGVELTLKPEAIVEGIVVDERNVPVPSAKVARRVMDPAGHFSISMEDADGEGRFRIAQLPEGPCNLRPLHPGSDYGWNNENWPETVDLRPGDHIKNVRLVLDTSGVDGISGRVTDESGNPIQRARLTASGMNSHGSASTDADGRYMISGLTGESYMVQVSASDFAGDRREGIAPGTKNLDFVLGAIGVISGTVVDASTRQPIPHFEVAVDGDWRTQPYAHTRFTSFSDAQGRFEVKAQGQGGSRVFARAEGYALASQVVPQLGPGERADDLILALPHARPLTGTVVNTEGEAVAGAYILVDSRSGMQPEHEARTQTDGNGAFTLTDLSPGVHTIAAHHAGYAATSVEVDTTRQQEVRIILGAGGMVGGVVTLGGAPVAGVRVNALTMDYRGGQIPTSQTDASGRYELKGVTPGMVYVSAFLRLDDGSQRTKQREAEVANNAYTEVNIDFPENTAVVEGYVYGADGAPARASVQVMHAGGIRNVATGETDETGFYRVTGIEGGDVTVMAVIQTPGATQPTLLSAQLTLAEGEVVRHDFDLSQASSVVCNVAGVPAEIRNVSVIALRGAVDAGQLTVDRYQELARNMAGAGITQGNGSTTIHGLTPGEYTLLGIAMGSNPDPNDPFGGALIVSVPLTVPETAGELAVDLVF